MVGSLSALAPAFPLATALVDPLRGAYERDGRADFSLLWSGEAAALAREEDAGVLTQRLWGDALACAAGCATHFRRAAERARQAAPARRVERGAKTDTESRPERDPEKAAEKAAETAPGGGHRRIIRVFVSPIQAPPP
ncbi:hypothetical protein [Burkholderia anthina]|uniref:2-nitropropane dioxygenase n=1 Tax=Burkholderia anthina TaxID=179879 RepID=A0A6P2GL39_9BURK|nr:hypothetical protein [Burkholderia anthina]VVU53567.1 2-nitropropane dioxygenase [Burkholderia anthina]